MTKEPEIVTQMDRDAAASLLLEIDYVADSGAGWHRDGRFDNSHVVQAFARHRRIATKASAPAGVVADGWRLVPVEPTQTMLEAAGLVDIEIYPTNIPPGLTATNSKEARAIWDEMLRVSPASEAHPSAGVEDADEAASAYAAEYAMSTEGADYVPTDWERELIEDALHGFLAERPATPPASVTPSVEARLREALEPFAKEADNQERTTSFSHGGCVILRTKLTIGDLRRARSALTGSADHG